MNTPVQSSVHYRLTGGMKYATHNDNARLSMVLYDASYALYQTDTGVQE